MFVFFPAEEPKFPPVPVLLLAQCMSAIAWFQPAVMNSTFSPERVYSVQQGSNTPAEAAVTVFLYFTYRQTLLQPGKSIGWRQA
jgi:hypothetical protein